MAHAASHPPAPSVSRSCQELTALNLGEFIQQLFSDIRDVAQIIAPIAAVIGFLGLGIMYMGSSWPIVGDWKGRP